ncbi:hypothetical protein PPN31114_01688 [Pandoraea pneumonica]|jgi:hypothetical protein|uniref:Uncharacterized protein n=1 Tax=Pandoraea pneumonica TaxID=2508299 RepID=A0A5E4TVK2_9BURK|nr:hypothetical protein [Pandoraea pneumonica]VVD91551.1 hypothetical protein PPN31114_01688 [Pandoraea pneumonica]
MNSHPSINIMETRVFGNIQHEGLEVVEREGRYFVRYDAGAHQIAWREDEISAEEFVMLKSGTAGQYQCIIGMQKRLRLLGIDPYQQNWVPSGV